LYGVFVLSLVLVGASIVGVFNYIPIFKASRNAALSGLGRVTSGPLRKRATGASPISEWILRLYSYSTQACVASLSLARVRSDTSSSMASCERGRLLRHAAKAFSSANPAHQGSPLRSAAPADVCGGLRIDSARVEIEIQPLH